MNSTQQAALRRFLHLINHKKLDKKQAAKIVTKEYGVKLSTYYVDK